MITIFITIFTNEIKSFMTMLDYLIQNLWLSWLLLGIICLIVEMTNGDFFLMSFAIGGFFTSLLSVFIDNIVAQVILFAIISLLSIYFIRPIALKYLHQTQNRRLSNAEALIGREGKVTDLIEAGGYGRVQIDGDSWKAQSNDGGSIEIGKDVRILRLDSIIVTVEEC